MDFSDKFKNTNEAILVNLPNPYNKWNGKKVKILDRHFKGYTKWHYKVEGFDQWLQQGCLDKIDGK